MIIPVSKCTVSYKPPIYMRLTEYRNSGSGSLKTMDITVISWQREMTVVMCWLSYTKSTVPRFQ